MGCRYVVRIVEAARELDDIIRQVSRLSNQMRPCELAQFRGDECWQAMYDDNGDRTLPLPDDACDACRQTHELWAQRRALKARKHAVMARLRRAVQALQRQEVRA